MFYSSVSSKRHFWKKNKYLKKQFFIWIIIFFYSWIFSIIRHTQYYCFVELKENNDKYKKEKKGRSKI